MKPVSSEALESQELAAAPGLGSDPVGMSEISNNKCVNKVVFTQVNERFFVVTNDLGI